MPYVLARHKVADFAKWKRIYDSHLPARQKAGLKELHLLRNADDSNVLPLMHMRIEAREPFHHRNLNRQILG